MKTFGTVWLGYLEKVYFYWKTVTWILLFNIKPQKPELSSIWHPMKTYANNNYNNEIDN